MNGIYTYILFIGALLLPYMSRSQGSFLAEPAATNSLRDDVYLHPIDAVSPYVLPKGEWIYGQSVQTLPFPSWAFYGLTERITIQIDLLPWLYGSFTELKKPIPSLNARMQLTEQQGKFPALGVEAMWVHFWDTLLRFETPNISVWENGSYFHLKPVAGYTWGNWQLDLSGGVDYMADLRLKNNADSLIPAASFLQLWSPNASVGLHFRPSDWISYHLALTYGATLTYLENVPRKSQITYGVRLAPFWKNKYGILRNMRVELVSINGYFADVEIWQAIPVPLFPYFYWQW